MTPAPAADEARHARHRDEVNETTRRFSRSLSEAFPDERAHSIERPAPTLWSLLMDWLMAPSPWEKT